MAGHKLFSVLSRAPKALFAREVLAVYPAIGLALFWFGTGGAAIAALAGVPLAVVAKNRLRRRLPDGAADPATAPRRVVTAALDRDCEMHAQTGKSSACIVVGLDDGAQISGVYGPEAVDRVVTRMADRLAGVLRDNDIVARIDATRFAIALAPARRVDLEAVIQVAGRVRTAIAEPFSIDAATVYVSVSVGFCLTARAPEQSGEGVLAAAELAQKAARQNGPGGIRAFSAELHHAASDQGALRDEVEAALENGEIVAYFQPQLSSDTGDVSGFEALARWQHPRRGILPPDDFLPAVHAAGLGARLGEVMLGQALSALRGWDRSGMNVPRVAVNVSAGELHDPNFAARIRWELDRFSLEPARLTIEVVESVVAQTGDDVVSRNLGALSRTGCGIDLDDFGTGNAALSAIRRFSVGRIKIDRSYVTRVDSDLSQQRMVAAILAMAERLGVETVGEGVETIGEHAHLAQLGCTHIQGFAIARPMPVEATEDWLRSHRAKLDATPGMDRRAG